MNDFLSTPPVQTAFVDARGQVSRVWLDWLYHLRNLTAGAAAGADVYSAEPSLMGIIKSIAEEIHNQLYLLPVKRDNAKETDILQIYSLNNKINQLEQRIELMPYPQKMKSIYPVGAVFLSVVSTNPNTLLGFGTWARIAEGQFLAGFKTGDANFDPVENTGGSITATHDNNHTGTAVTSHPESANVQGAAAGDVVTDGVHSVTQPAAHGDHAILNPFFVVYAWKRTT